MRTLIIALFIIFCLQTFAKENSPAKPGDSGKKSESARKTNAETSLEEDMRGDLLTFEQRERAFQESGVKPYIESFDDLDRDTLILIAQKTEISHLEKRFSSIPSARLKDLVESISRIKAERK